MIRKDISIIIVSWNAKRFLLECLKSIMADQTSIKYEIIVVDNGSSDGSAEEVLEHFPEVTLIQNNFNIGFAKANNIGIRQSQGRYACLVNSDIKILEGCFDRLVEYMDLHPSAGIAGPKLLWPDMTLQDSCRKFPSIWNNLCSYFWLNRVFPRSKLFSGEHMIYSPHDKICKVDYLVGAFLMVRKEAVDQVGLMDEQFFIYSEEVDWCKRFWKAGWEIIFLPDARVIHYGGGSSSNQPGRFSLEQQRAKLQYWRKHHGRLAQASVILITIIHHLLRIFFGAMIYMTRPVKRKQAGLQIEKSWCCIQRLFSS